MDEDVEQARFEDLTKVWTTQEIAETNPFGEDATCILVDHHQLNVSQLTDEIAQAAGEQVQLAVLEVPEFGRRWMYVCPAIEADIVNRCIDDHVPNPDYGLPIEVLQREELRKKLEAGTPLTQDEVFLALRLSLTRF